MNNTLKRFFFSKVLCSLALFGSSASASLEAANDKSSTLAKLLETTRLIEHDVITWRRDIHQHPELANEEVRTAALVAEHLRSLGIEDVREGVARTGVTGTIYGANPGPTIALRADMDALPITERTGLSFRSTKTQVYGGEQTGVMHACGHDAHTAILMGVASTISAMKDKLHGNVTFIFQPAEEGDEHGRTSGAELMLAEKVLQTPSASAIFGLHVFPGPSGQIGYKSKGVMASAYPFEIVITGEQTHGAMPWAGKDPITTSAQIILALQLIPSRQIDISQAPALISVGKISGGKRSNIIPEQVKIVGTIRNLNPDSQQEIFDRIVQSSKSIAESAGLQASVNFKPGYPVTYNDPKLLQQILPSLQKEGIATEVLEVEASLGAEDFSFFQQKVPGVFLKLGISKPSPAKQYPNHSPYFDIDESAMLSGVRALSIIVLDQLSEGNNERYSR